MSRLALCAIVFALACSINTYATAETPPSLWLFQSGQHPYPRFRIPALILTPQGTLLAFCEGRRDGGGLMGDIDIVLRRSKDNGKTWEPLELVADLKKDTLGNPCPVIDRKTGALWLLLTVSPGEKSEEQIISGESEETTRVLVTSSKDEGRTWTELKDITPQAKRKEWTWYGTGPGVGIQLESGRLLIPSYHAEQETKIYKSHALYSDDAGQTWRIGESLADHTSESAALERADGSVYYSARTVTGKEERSVADSTDGGQTFKHTRLNSTLYDPHCQGSLLAFSPAASATVDEKSDGKGPDAKKPLWIYCHPSGPGRRNLAFHFSRDEGQTWPRSKPFVPGDSQYSSLAELPDGTIGCLYESWRENNYQIYFARLPIDWLLSPEAE